MPALTNLHLKDSIPNDAENLRCSSRVVDLPCLRVLNISSGIGAVTRTAVLPVRHITFPRSAILNLTCKENQSIQIDFSSFFRPRYEVLANLGPRSFEASVCEF